MLHASNCKTHNSHGQYSSGISAGQVRQIDVVFAKTRPDATPELHAKLQVRRTIGRVMTNATSYRPKPTDLAANERISFSSSRVQGSRPSSTENESEIENSFKPEEVQRVEGPQKDQERCLIHGIAYHIVVWTHICRWYKHEQTRCTLSYQQKWATNI